MIIDGSGPQRRLLSYCTNVHPGETVTEVMDDLRQFAVPLRQRFGEASFALGLRLGEAAITELDNNGETLQTFKAFLDQEHFTAYTLNVFPQGAFHAPEVKRAVYRPDWSESSRADYTVAAARVLAQLLDDDDPFGTLSTLPLGWVREKGPATTLPLREAGAKTIADVAHRLALLESDSGRCIQLCVEPEPLCVLETTSETIEWFQDCLWALATGIEAVDGRSGPEQVRRHIGVCYDACHLSVEHEDVPYGMERLERAGIPIGKIQLSCALELRRPRENSEGLLRLLAFDEPRFLHQVVALDGKRRLLRFDDLGRFATWLDATSSPVHSARCHFHVPIHLPSAWPLHTTQASLRDLLHREQTRRSVRHIEVETYTFSVLPERLREEVPLVDSLERELVFARDGLLRHTAR